MLKNHNLESIYGLTLMMIILPGMDVRMAQCNEYGVPGLKLRATIRVPGISGARFRDMSQGQDTMVSLNGHDCVPSMPDFYTSLTLTYSYLDLQL